LILRESNQIVTKFWKSPKHFFPSRKHTEINDTLKLKLAIRFDFERIKSDRHKVLEKSKTLLSVA